MSADITVWTIGHSNLPIERFLELLERASIGMVADVRRFPSSKRHPHFNAGALAAALEELGIGHRHFETMGGRRKDRLPNSPNSAWRVEAFNAFADHMASEDFRASLEELLAEAKRRNVAIMCSEALPWQCHRRLIADALFARGARVLDLMPNGKVDEHKLTPFAVVKGLEVHYPSSPELGV